MALPGFSAQLLAPLLLLLLLSSAPFCSAIDLLTWGQKCDKASTTLTTGECDQSVGLNCYTYSQGDYCGCYMDGPTSWDAASKQCRRKPFYPCNYYPNPVVEESIHISQRCHTGASCLHVNSTVVKTSHPPRQCICNEGFKPGPITTGVQPWKCEPIKGGAASLVVNRGAVAFVYTVLALIVCSNLV